MPETILRASWIELKLQLEKVYQRQPDEVLGRLQSDLLPTFNGQYSRTNSPLDPLDAVFIYENNFSPQHWHYISFGLSDLYSTTLAESGISGKGFEISFRLPKSRGEQEPPHWPAMFMQSLARYSFQSSTFYKRGHHQDIKGPILIETPGVTSTAIVFTYDPQLLQIDTASGSVDVLQFVGITAEELASAKGWNTKGLLNLIAIDNPLLVTDIFRQSVTENASHRKVIADGIERDGSSTAYWFVHALQPVLLGRGHFALRIPQKAVPEIRAAMRGRLRFGRDLRLLGSGFFVHFIPGERASVRECESDGLEVIVSDQLATEIELRLGTPENVYKFEHLPEFMIETHSDW